MLFLVQSARGMLDKQNNMAASSEDLIPKKGNVSSVIWNWFGFVASDTEQTAPRCKVCLKGVVNQRKQYDQFTAAPQTEACCRVGEVLLPTKGTRPRQPRHRHHKTTESLGNIYKLYAI